jgi:hypothetical protein
LYLSFKTTMSQQVEGIMQVGDSGLFPWTLTAMLWRTCTVYYSRCGSFLWVILPSLFSERHSSCQIILICFRPLPLASREYISLWSSSESVVILFQWHTEITPFQTGVIFAIVDHCLPPALGGHSQTSSV